MINLDMQVEAPNLTFTQEEALRLALRNAALAFVFKAADDVGIDHQTVLVTGTIKIAE